jgi:dienelactone hydrolase
MFHHRRWSIPFAAFALTFIAAPACGDDPPAARPRSAPPVIRSSWDDLLSGVKTADDWQRHRRQLKQRYLDLIRDNQKPAQRPSLDLQVHEDKVIDNAYHRLLISYNVEADERAHAYLGLPLGAKGKLPAVVALHGTYPQGIRQEAGLEPNQKKLYDNAYLDQMCRRGYVVIAPEHFVSGHRIPPEGPYETKRFYEKHPEWTAVGKFTYEHSIAIDVLETRDDVDRANIGAMGHSLGGHGTFFLAAYDDRIKAAVSNCGAGSLRHNSGVEHWARDHWYIYLKHIRPQLLAGQLPPIDMHEIISLIAPRAYLDVSALNDGDPLMQRQHVLMLLKIADVYQLVGKPENFAFFVHGRGHGVPHESRELIYGFLDAQLKPPEVTRTRPVSE